MEKIYIGDGVYVELDERGVVLTAENGIIATDTIVLEPAVLKNLLTFLKIRGLLT